MFSWLLYYCLIIIKRFRSLLSIIKLKHKLSFKRKFAFKLIREELVKNFVHSLCENKAAGGDILLSLLKESTFLLPYLVRCANEALVKSEFPDPLKLWNIVPVHKEKDPTDKSNYRPASAFPLLSKIFEKVMYQ